MTESYEVDTAALTAHARKLVELAGELQEAFDAVRSVSLGGDAYGETCREVSIALDEAGSAGRETVTAGVTAVDGAATGVRVTAVAYQQQETGSQQRFAALDGAPGTPARRPPAEEVPIA